MSDKHKSIKSLTDLRLPQPLAQGCWNYVNLGDENESEKLLRITRLFEVLVKLSASGAVSSFLSESDKFKDDEGWQSIRTRIEGLESPSLGHWVGTLRDVVNFYRKRKEERPDFIEDLVDYYGSKFQGGRDSDEFSSLAAIAGLMESKAPKPDVASTFDFFVTLRNRYVGHGADLNPVDLKRVVEALEIIFVSLVSNAEFLVQWTLIFVEKVEKKKGQTVVYVTKVFDGTMVRREEYTQENARYELCVDSEVYFAKIDKSEGRIAPVLQAVTLTPYIIYQACPSTKTDQLFFFNSKSRAGNLEYLCYVTGSKYEPPELVKDFENIASVLRGEMRASDVFRPLGEQNERVPSPDERRQAEIVALDAVNHIRAFDAERALRSAGDALKIDPNCAIGFFARGLAYCQLGNANDAGSSFSRAAELSASEPAYLLADAMVLLMREQSKESEAAFRKLQRCDPTNEYVAEYLASPEKFAHKKLGSQGSVDAKLKHIGKLILRQLDDDKQEIVSWLFRLPPWKQMYQLSIRAKYPVPPVLSSFVGAFLVFLIPIVVHFPTLLQWGLFASESIALYSRHATIAFVTFFGFYNVFYMNRVLRRVFTDLGKLVIMPRLPFRHWFMSEVGSVWGAANLSKSKESITDVRGLFDKDLKLLLPFLFVFLTLIPVQHFCAGDFDPATAYPSELSHSLRNGLVSEATISSSWAVVQIVTRYSIYILEAYLVAYGVTFIAQFVFFFAKMIELPARYYPGIPNSLTFKTVSNSFISIAWLGPLFTLSVFLQLMAFDCYSVVPWAAWIYVSLCAVFVPLYILIPTAGVYRAMCSQRARVVEEFSGNVENSYTVAISKADDESFSLLKGRADFIRRLYSDCPVFPLTRGAFISVVLILVALLISMSMYIYLSVCLDWPKF